MRTFNSYIDPLYGRAQRDDRNTEAHSVTGKFFQCDVCLNAFRRTHALERELLGPEIHGNPLVHDLHRSWESFRSSVEDGCVLCNVLWHELDINETPKPDFTLKYMIIFPEDQPYPYKMLFECYEGDKVFKDRGFDFTEVMHEATEGEKAARKEWGDGEMAELAFERGAHRVQPIFKREFDLEAGGVGLYPLEKSTGSSCTLRLARTWLNECRAKHVECRASSHQALAAPPENIHDAGMITVGKTLVRLLRIDSSPSSGVVVRLVETEDLHAFNYASLSHRWSAERPLELTTETQGLLFQGLDASMLSKTFQDALQVAIAVDIHYMWIDSLCIKQDSPSDWRQQASMMGEIYSKATINIAATKAENSAAGMFAERNPMAVTPPEITLTWIGWIGTATRAYRLLPSSSWSRNVEQSRLADRGWIFQERLLSRRVIHFTPEQVFWECRCTAASEMSPTGRPYLATFGSPYKNFMDRAKDFVESHPKGFQPDVRDPAVKRALQCWVEIVKKYSACQFTKPQDKLIALHGVAAQMYDGLGEPDHFIDGHWVHLLPEELLWTAARTDQNGSMRYSPGQHRIKEPRNAPTWSWASIDGPIMPFNSHLTLYDAVFDMSRTISCATRRLWELINVKAFDVESSDEEWPSWALGTHSFWVELEGTLLDAMVAHIPIDRHNIPGDARKEYSACFVKMGPDVDGTAYIAELCIDDPADFQNRIYASIRGGRMQRKLVAVPAYWNHSRDVLGLLLEEARPEDRLVTGSSTLIDHEGKSTFAMGDDADSLPCFTRVGLFHGTNFDSESGEWGDRDRLLRSEKKRFKLM